jgi:thiol-disulfide isomerase/thioredoxin
MRSFLEEVSRDRPTLIEVSAPSCAECRAMQPDLETTAANFTESVRLTVVNAAEYPELARSMGAMATPTLIGVSEGEEMFRAIGRRTRAEIDEMFRALERGETVRGIGRHDRKLRIGAGLALMLLGTATGPAWPLIAVGGAISTWGLSSLRGSSRA